MHFQMFWKLTVLFGNWQSFSNLIEMQHVQVIGNDCSIQAIIILFSIFLFEIGYIKVCFGRWVLNRTKITLRLYEIVQNVYCTWLKTKVNSIRIHKIDFNFFLSGDERESFLYWNKWNFEGTLSKPKRIFSAFY